MTPLKGSIFSNVIKSSVSNVDIHSNSLIGNEELLLVPLDRFLIPTTSELKLPVSVENFNGPPKIDCLLGSGIGSVKFIFEQEIRLNANIIYKNRIIYKP